MKKNYKKFKLIVFLTDLPRTDILSLLNKFSSFSLISKSNDKNSPGSIFFSLFY